MGNARLTEILSRILFNFIFFSYDQGLQYGDMLSRACFLNQIGNFSAEFFQPPDFLVFQYFKQFRQISVNRGSGPDFLKSHEPFIIKSPGIVEISDGFDPADKRNFVAGREVVRDIS